MTDPCPSCSSEREQTQMLRRSPLELKAYSRTLSPAPTPAPHPLQPISENDSQLPMMYLFVRGHLKVVCRPNIKFSLLWTQGRSFNSLPHHLRTSDSCPSSTQLPGYRVERHGPQGKTDAMRPRYPGSSNEDWNRKIDARTGQLSDSFREGNSNMH